MAEIVHQPRQRHGGKGRGSRLSERAREERPRRVGSGQLNQPTELEEHGMDGLRGLYRPDFK